MRLVMIAAVAVLALAATAAFAQDESPPPTTAGSGTAKAPQPGPDRWGKPVSPSTARSDGVSQRRKAVEMPRPGSVPQQGQEKPAGTTGAPPYGSSTPNPNSSSPADSPQR